MVFFKVIKRVKNYKNAVATDSKSVGKFMQSGLCLRVDKSCRYWN